MTKLGALIAATLIVAACSARSAPHVKGEALQPLLATVVTYYERGELPRAIAELQRLIVRHRDEPHLHFMLANALYRQGLLQNAADAYDQALVLNPGHFEARVSRGFTLYELGRCNDATAEWRRAVSVVPDEALARAALAVGLHCLGQTQDAEQQYADAIDLDGRYASPKDLQVDIRWKESAVNALERLLSMETANYSIRHY